MSMTPKARLLAALTGKEIDRVPWSPFLAYWWDGRTQYHDMGQLAFLESVGADPLLRGFSMPFRFVLQGVNVRENRFPGGSTLCWDTPVGTLTFGYKLSEEGNTNFLVHHPIEDAEDLKTLMWVYEHAKLEHDPACDEQVKMTGSGGCMCRW